MRPLRTLVALCSAAALCACGFPAPAPETFTVGGPWDAGAPASQGPCGWDGAGLSGKACWSWVSSETEDEPIAEGARDSIEVRSAVQVAAIASSDASVASFSLQATDFDGTNQLAFITVQAGRPGGVQLILTDASGAEIDRIPIVVAATSALLPSFAGQTLQAFVAAPLEYHVTTYASGGVATAGVGGVVFTEHGPVQPVPGLNSGDYGDIVLFEGNAPGPGQLVATAGSFSTALQLQFVEPSAVTAIQLVVGTSNTGGGVGQGSISIDAIATDSAGIIYGHACRWETSSPYFNWVEGGVYTFDDQLPPASEHAEFSLAQQGLFTATCTIGQVSATASFSWP